jgi:hypothetical protein
MGLIISFFDSNFFVALVGFLAIYIYFKQKTDRKRNAARLILQEIRYAEQQIRNSDRGRRGYQLSSRLLPTNSLNDNLHLFAEELKETQIDMISEFYSKAAYIDYLISERSRQRLNQNFSFQPMVSPVSANIDAGGTRSPIAPTLSQELQITQLPNPNEQIAIALLTEVSLSTEFLYNTPAVEKLRQISERKWYQPF